VGSALRALLIAGALLLVAMLGYGWYQLSPPSAIPDPVEVEIEPGWGASRISSDLAARGLIRDDTMFSLWLRLRGIDRQIGEGVYDLSPHLGAPEIGRRLAAGGRPRTITLIVPEGFRMVDVAARIASAGLADVDAALGRMREPGDLKPAYIPEGLGLEGYLFPAAYEVPLVRDVDTLLERMIDRFRDEIGAVEIDRLVDLGLHVHEWVTLASMVQAEAANDEEMPIVAGVFMNRRDLGMPMQSDPTVAYGLGKDLPELDAVAGDMRRDHPWNTYTQPGLPIGPIGNPGRAALQAVLFAQRTNEAGEDYLYFLHGLDGDQPVFRPNISFEAHERDIDRYLR
jgi:UPF0755 protein